MKKLLASVLFGVAMFWGSAVFGCDYGVVQIRQPVAYSLVYPVVEQVEVQQVRVQKVVQVQQQVVYPVVQQVQVQKVVQPAVKVQVRTGLFGIRRTNVTIR